MCVQPQWAQQQTEGAEPKLVACRVCWECKKNRIDDLVGRCIAEQEYSSATYALTLTYRDDAENAAHSAVLVYADFQKFIKRLRYHGYSVRYIVAGEYGSKKGRAHWHAILFFAGKTPEVANSDMERSSTKEIVLDQRIIWDHWPHGYVYFQQSDYEGFSYVLKYVLKDVDQDTSIGHYSLSKKPPLGHGYFMDLAQRYVDQHLAPQDFYYSFPHVKDRKGKKRRFYLQGKSRENFLTRFIELWENTHGTPAPISEKLQEWDDLLARDLRKKELEAESLSEARERRTLGIAPIRSSGIRADTSADQVPADLMDCVKRVGVITLRAGRKVDVTVYEWLDGSVTVSIEDVPEWVLGHKVYDRGPQWHTESQEEAAKWLRNFQLKASSFVGGIARPEPMPRYVRPTKKPR